MKTEELFSALSLGLLTVFPAVALPPESEHGHRSQYAGMESREIKSLSPEDVRQLREGHGWGLSLVAELNGVPGPRHLLELERELQLGAQQVSAIGEIYRKMKGEAVVLGEELIRLERQLDASFASSSIDEAGLRDQLHAIARTRRDLRYVHLAAHLQTPKLLTQDQIAAYNRLRGYDPEDPCLVVPPGHDPKMWRLHNGCDG